MVYRTYQERTRFIMAAGVALACGMGLAPALPLPESVTDPRFELVLIDGAGESFVVDYDLTLTDCVNRWPDFPGFTLACEREGSR